MTLKPIALIAALLLAGAQYAAAEVPTASQLPDVASRTYAQNYKDLALATCVARAYASEPGAAADAAATAAGLESTWTNYDLENANGQLGALVGRYLARPSNSIHGPEIRLDLLKCLDMYHSKELELQVKRLVITPNRSYKQDNAIRTR